MKNYVIGKTVIITGSGGRRGFGCATAEKLASLGANVIVCGRNTDSVNETISAIRQSGGSAVGVKADVSSYEDNKLLVKTALDCFGRLDVFVANAGIMPLAFWADSETAMPSWEQCIDTNYKGVMYGIAASREALAANCCGQFVVLSSIYANVPVTGAAVYQSTKIAARYMVETLRQEEFGRIKTTIINPTGVPTTALMKTVVNKNTYTGGIGSHLRDFERRNDEEKQNGRSPAAADESSPKCYILSASAIADGIVKAINQPAGVSYSEMTIRATNELFTM